MDETFATIAVGNAKRLCVGAVTRREAVEARASGVEIDHHGIYLYLASDDDPSSPIEILAKFFSLGHAERAAELLG